jgi:polyphosphate kinase
MAKSTKRIKKSEYEALLEPMQLELNHVAHWLAHTGKRAVVLLEGRDTAGKGGTINAITATLNPRQVHVVALSKPTERERSQWYFQRYLNHLPSAGELVLFDRSWYNRAGVEKVMGFCTKEEYELFLKQAPAFERMLVDEGILLFKYWLAVDQAQQEERFAERAADPLKRWKLSPIDLKAREHYEAYGKAREAMFEATHTKWAPWYVVDFNDQRRGRLTLIRHLLDQLPADELPPDPPLELPPLGRKAGKERYTGKVKPLPSKW